MNMDDGKPTVMDLFAGAGGFSLGFSEAGFPIATAIEIDEWASETFQSNFPEATVITRDFGPLRWTGFAGFPDIGLRYS